MRDKKTEDELLKSLPDGHRLTHKEFFVYTTEKTSYEIELYSEINGPYYAVGIPQDGPMVIYGSSRTDSAYNAIQVVLDKIQREEHHFLPDPPFSKDDANE